MPILKSIAQLIKWGVTIILPFSFLLMPLNITLYYGFIPTIVHTSQSISNPFGLTIVQIWLIHLSLGLLAGMVLSNTKLLLTGSLGMLSALLITGTSFLYFGWRKEINTLETLIPLIIGILPPLKIQDWINQNNKTI